MTTEALTLEIHPITVYQKHRHSMSTAAVTFEIDLII